jgi:Phosphotransferase enzyme family
MDPVWHRRLARHRRLSSRLSALTDSELRALGKSVPPPRGAWGTSGVARMGNERVFVKRIPITALELAREGSTKNHYRLPLHYAYGVGSLGFGVWREHAALQKTSSWVSSGLCPSFPLVHHWRILRKLGRPRGLDAEDQARYVRYWNGSKRVGQFHAARAAATSELIAVLECREQTLLDAVRRDPLRTEDLVGRSVEAARFLGRHGLVHFDLHHRNVMIDRRGAYLIDFGLVWDEGFELSARERAFGRAHRAYDEALLVALTAWHVLGKFREASPRTQTRIRSRIGIERPGRRPDLLRALLENLEAVTDRGGLRLPKSYVDIVERSRELTLFVSEFLRKMGSGKRKTYRLDTNELERLLSRSR